ncbi:MAG TPA: hypothetical protein VHD36_23690 [Pirellulales bacterium]|nr:hypothetical protein [Pirellulales bacterium]
MPPSTQSPAADMPDVSASADDVRPLTIPRPGLPWRRIGGSFLLMLGIYWFYALAIVPFIEPTAEVRPEFDEIHTQDAPGTNVVDRQRAALMPWFSPGDWELTSPKVIESPRGKLLLHEYETLADGRLKIKPCTMIFLHEGEAESEADRNRRAVILQAPEGAILRFDTPVDLRQSKMGKLIGGQMMGPITIRSDQRLPGPQDDLLIKTRDAELVGDKIVTPHPVDFRLGPNRGNGRDLEIVLAPSAHPIPNSPAPGFGGVNSVTLKKDVRMRLYPGQADMFPGPATPAPKAAPTAGKADESLPVDITCDGAFQFDVTRFAAIFRKKVDVLRTNADGPSDQLNCEVLSLFFEPAGGGGAAPAPAARRGGFGNLEPSRVEAEGDPVVIRSPSRGVQARGTRLEYDIKKNAGGMKGPGWMKAERPGDAKARPVEATWKRELEFGPYEGVQCAKLAGDAQFESPGVGLLKAETIRLFMIEDPDVPATTTERRRLVPDRLQAFERVHFESPTLSGDVHHLQVWLRRPPPSRAIASAARGAPAVAGPRRPGTAPVAAAAATTANANPLSPAAAPNADGRQIHVSGELLQVEALLGEESTDVTRIHIERKVELRELKVAEPGARPMTMRGDQLDVEQPLPNQAVAHIVGNPAHIVAREMTIDGNDIHVDRGNNRAWVNGHGVMTIMIPPGQVAAMQPGAMPSAKPATQPAGPPRPLEITWKGRMDFDGRDAMFQEGVVVVTEQQKITPEGLASDEHQRLTCNWLQATFEPRVTFDQMDPQARPQIRQVLCRENVALEQRTTLGGKPNSIERLVALDLKVEPLTNNLLANGPGWVRRAWIDTGSGTPRMPGAPPQSAPPQQGKPTKRLLYLGINFQGLLAGNQTQQAMDFQDRVRCVYSPIADWDAVVEPDDPDKLVDGAILLTSDRLQVVRTAAVAAQGQPFELTATGNAKLDGRAGGPGGDAADPSKSKSRGQMFSASAARLNYAAAKDLFVLEGDGRNYAYLARQERVGAPFDEQSAGKFLFWPSLNQLQVQDAHSLHIQSLESNANRRDRQPPAAPSAAAPPAQRR